jgi:hypothetical protein
MWKLPFNRAAFHNATAAAAGVAEKKLHDAGNCFE